MGTGTGAGMETRAVPERRMGTRMLAETGMKTRSGGAKERRRSEINRTSVVDAMWEMMETWVVREKYLDEEGFAQ